MKIVSVRKQIQRIADEFAHLAQNEMWGVTCWGSQDKETILHKLQTMDTETITADEVNAITSPNSYINQIECSECGGLFDHALLLGNSRKICICKGCLESSLKLLPALC